MGSFRKAISQLVSQHSEGKRAGLVTAVLELSLKYADQKDSAGNSLNWRDDLHRIKVMVMVFPSGESVNNAKEDLTRGKSDDHSFIRLFNNWGILHLTQRRQGQRVLPQSFYDSVLQWLRISFPPTHSSSGFDEDSYAFFSPLDQYTDRKTQGELQFMDGKFIQRRNKDRTVIEKEHSWWTNNLKRMREEFKNLETNGFSTEASLKLKSCSVKLPGRYGQGTEYRNTVKSTSVPKPPPQRRKRNTDSTKATTQTASSGTNASATFAKVMKPNDFQERVAEPERPPGTRSVGGSNIIHLKSSTGNTWYNPSSSITHTQNAQYLPSSESNASSLVTFSRMATPIDSSPWGIPASPASSDGCSSGSSQSSSSKSTSPDSVGSHAGQSSHAVQEFTSLEPSEHSGLVPPIILSHPVGFCQEPPLHEDAFGPWYDDLYYHISENSFHYSPCTPSGLIGDPPKCSADLIEYDS